MRTNAIALLLIASAFATFTPRMNAGTDMVIDNSAQAPPPVYYAPPPAPVVAYYAPPPVQVVVHPSYLYYSRPYRVYGSSRVHRHHAYWHHGGGH